MDPAQRRGPRHSSMIQVIEVLVAVVLMTTPWLWSALRFGR